MSISTETIKLLDKYDAAPLECDGLTRVLHTVLSWEMVPHIVMYGGIHDKLSGKRFYPHYWIAFDWLQVPPEQVTIADYRAKMWLGDYPHVPHGVFAAGQYPHIHYAGVRQEMDLLNKTLFDFLVSPEGFFKGTGS